ncbi:MAG: hemolysin family protein [Gemmatimonadales bacterium]|jgi:putative hemolysin
MIGTALVLVLLLAMSGFFSSAEIAFFSISQTRARSLAEEGKRGANALARLKANPERLLITILIGNNVANIGAASVATYAATQLFGSAGVGLATGVMTLLVLFFGEITPKSFAVSNAMRLSLGAAPVIEMLQRVLSPLVRPLESLTRWILPKAKGGSGGVSEMEIRRLSQMAYLSGMIDERERRLIEQAFLLDTTKARDAMTPRVEIFAWPETLTVGEIATELRSLPYSRIPVYEDTVDRITGVVHLRDLYQAISSGRRLSTLRELAREPFVVPEMMPLSALLEEFQSRRIHLGIVVDEYGGTDGLITLEDILEELVGEIHDEVDIPEEQIVRLGRNKILVDASAELRDINHFFNTSFPDDEHRSLNGYVLHELGRVPARGETTELDGVRIEVLGASDTQITHCRLVRLPAERREGSDAV